MVADDVLGAAAQASVVTVIGYPLDTLTKLQQTHRLGLVATLRNTRLRHLYHGVAVPFVSHIVKRGTQLPVGEALRRHARQRGWGVASNYAIGAATGCSMCLVGTPLQVLKVGMQTHANDMSYLRFTRALVAAEGVRGLYRGLAATAAKDTLLGGSFVGHYFTLRECGVHPFAAGALAHAAAWAMCMPLDFAKTLAQNGEDALAGRPAPALMHVLRTTPLRTLWIGLAPTLARNVVVSGFGMTAYERTRKWARSALAAPYF